MIGSFHGCQGGKIVFERQWAVEVRGRSRRYPRLFRTVVLRLCHGRNCKCLVSVGLSDKCHTFLGTYDMWTVSVRSLVVSYLLLKSASILKSLLVL